MADNVAITAGAGTSIATDDVGGFHFQRVKPAWGVDGSAVDTSATNPLPVREQAMGTVAHNKVTVTTAGTRVQFGSQATESVVVKASRNNSGTMYLGTVTVTSSNGFELDPGDAVVLPVSNAYLLYVDAATGSDYVTWIAVD